ncbi:hypothetical protein [Streptomyces sp. IB2014 016-6]|uniref:hypothetical protein n=1 Tax=Streptomyces sp. IB2014 016-6 TaxID=2517818 RepID=UPI0011C7E5EA|nr:hypothetical protein [Streptomyces sp. IB2014 016-6]TXL86886.1 hypothetical protein EW053_24880 [Streptomyces sp. IB2014 016-6]
MSEVLSLDALAAPLRALRLITVDFPDLPAPSLGVSTVYPNRLTLSLHWRSAGDSFAAFEQWRNALSIEPDAVTFHMQCDGLTGVLEASVTFAGADIELVAYAHVPQSANSRTGVLA